MATRAITGPDLDDHAEPAWEVALLFPAQGEWSEDEYLWLTDHTKYGEYGVFPRGTQATSALLEGFTVAVAAVLDAM
jgi:hypothetical protein